ncbi:MAG TPA: hypothetical protein VER03_15860 [Bryobacteraceae bacterium]|nr:hypothetical protein [Bryobacteraceae bacterium]
MRTASLLLFGAALASAYQVIQSGSVSTGGVGFRYETRVEPRLDGQKVTGFNGGGVWRYGPNIHRVLKDDETRRYVGYDVMIEKRADGLLTFTLGPLSLSAEKLSLKGEWTQVPLRVNSTPQVVKTGDEIAINLFTNSSTGQKVVDHLFFDQRTSDLRLPEGPARDFTVADVPIRLTGPKISLNGRLMQSAEQGDMSGETVHFYLAGHGRYSMSLAPNIEFGFRKLGEVRGTRITYRDGNDTWTIESMEPIAPGGGVFHLYVLAEPAWRPSGEGNFFMGASSGRGARK